MFDYYGGKNHARVKFYKAKYIIVWDEGQHKTLENGYLGVSGDTVTGFFTKIPKNAPFEDLGNVAITPGFINMHTHPCEVYSLKSYREDIGNPYFFEGTLYDYALVMSLGERGAYLQAKLNLAEILKSGCTTTLIYGRRLFEDGRRAGWRNGNACLCRRSGTCRRSL